MVMPRSRSMSIESRIWSRKSRASTAPQRWIRRSASVLLPWSIWAMMQKLRVSNACSPAPAGAARGSELQHHLDHVVLIAVGVGAVARDEVFLEPQAGHRLHGVGFEIGDEHAGQMAQPVVACDTDEVVHQDGAEAEAAVFRIEQPLDPPDQPQR